jgi:rubrerythrin
VRTLKCLLCGMKINEKNYNLNYHTFVEKNKENKIINCPFCGANEAYLDNEREIYELDIKSLDTESLKVLEKAMKLEVFNGEFYEEASRLATDEKIKKTFKELSSIEFMHARIHKRLGAFEKLPKLHRPDYTRHNTDDLLLREANKREKHAISFYTRNYVNVSCQIIKEIFNALSDVEKQHVVITEA